MVCVVGVDEVGRGALAGPLCVAAYAFFPDLPSSDVLSFARDSKSFSSRDARHTACAALEAVGLCSLVWILPADIPKGGLTSVLMGAMRDAALDVCEALWAQGVVDIDVVFDGPKAPLPEVSLPSGVQAWRPLVKADRHVSQVGAASVVAKVRRDEEMDRLAVLCPSYGWERNAGYGTSEHLSALARCGLTPHHRVWANRFVSSV